MLTGWLDWLDLHAGAVQGVSTIVLVFITGILVRVTWTYAISAKRQADHAERQVEEAQQQRFDQHRPVLYPSGSPPLSPDNNHVDWSSPYWIPALTNAGNGVALTICGVLFPPRPEIRLQTLSQRYTVWRQPPLLPGAERQSRLEIGRTKMSGDATIAGYQLFAPTRPTEQEMMIEGRYNVLARLSLTYEDISSRKHAAVFDYIDIYGWQCIALLTGIPKDLEILDREWSSLGTTAVDRGVDLSPLG